MSMPKQKPGRSKQDYQTPKEFMVAVKRFLRIDAFAVDLAANEINRQAPRWVGPGHDALSPLMNWARIAEGGWAWLNPPYANIGLWAEKCLSSGCRIAFLVPASVGSNWFYNYVHGHAYVLFLNGRLSFTEDGQPYPKDCMLVLYGYPPGYAVWDWRS